MPIRKSMTVERENHGSNIVDTFMPLTRQFLLIVDLVKNNVFSLRHLYIIYSDRNRTSHDKQLDNRLTHHIKILCLRGNVNNKLRQSRILLLPPCYVYKILFQAAKIPAAAAD